MKDLEAVLKAHAAWLQDPALGERANLQGANLHGANLRNANLQGADLQDASLQGADLWGASLQGADLWGASLQGANLQDTNLQDANLQDANLRGANLWRADLQGANLQDANLQDANLQGADLQNANLRGADLQDTHLPPFQIPAGDIIGWKVLSDGYICKLRIPFRARRAATLIGRKCRAELAEVLAIEPSGTPEGYSLHDGTPYRVGETVYPDSYDPDPRVECTNGIHFFLTRGEAEEY